MSWDQSEKEPIGNSLLKRTVSDFHNPQLDLITQLGRSQTPLQGALNSPTIGQSQQSLTPQIQSLSLAQQTQMGVNLTTASTNNTSTNNAINVHPPGLLPIVNDVNHGTNESSNGFNALDDRSRKSDEEMTHMDRYGINGLLPLIRMENGNQTTVALGTDLNLLGMDMSPESVDVKLAHTFASPWVETSRSEVEPAFDQKFKPIPINDSIQVFQEKLPLLTDETLFYIFYTRPRDALQELSARELQSRNWRYHKELQVWLTKDSSVEPVQINNVSEKGLYVFFDPHSWEKIRKEFVLYYHAIMTGA